MMHCVTIYGVQYCTVDGCFSTMRHARTIAWGVGESFKAYVHVKTQNQYPPTDPPTSYQMPTRRVPNEQVDRHSDSWEKGPRFI